MKLAVAALVLSLGPLGLGACVIEPPPDDGYDPGGNGGWGSGWGGSGGSTGYGCASDSACGTGYVCARNGECTTASGVKVARTTWTMQDQIATDATCSSAKYLDITFSTSSGEEFGFSPVPCNAGKFTIDKLPLRYSIVTLSRMGDYSGGASGSFDAQGNAALDLPY